MKLVCLLFLLTGLVVRGNFSELLEKGKVVEELAPRLQKATVSLLNKGGLSYGSGVIVSEDGLVLTAEHVVTPMKHGVIVMFSDGSRKMGRVLGLDRKRGYVEGVGGLLTLSRLAEVRP